MVVVGREDRAGRNMIAASDEYKASIVQKTDRRIYGKVEINFTDPLVDQTIVVNNPAIETEDGYLFESEDGFIIQMDRDLSESTYWDQVADGILEPTANWFPLDGSAILDGSFVLMPPGDDTYDEPSQETGWWGDEVSGAGGTFTDAQVLSVSFSARTIESLLICSDTIKNEYPVDFTIGLYDATDTSLYTETVAGNAFTYWAKTITPVAGIVCLVLTITKWAHVGRCAKIYEVFTSIHREYTGDSIFEMELLEERNPDTASIPIGNISSNQFTLKLFNFARQFDYGSGSAIASFIKPNRKITPYIGAVGVGGEIEWIPLGVFWSQEWDVPDNDQYAATVAEDILSLMSMTSYMPGLLVNKTLYEIIEDACIDYGLTAGTYFIDPLLDISIIAYSYIPETTHREAIRLAAEAGLASVFSDRNGILRVEGPLYMNKNRVESERTVTASEYFIRKNPSRYSQLCNVVNVNVCSFAPDASPSSVYDNKTITIPANTQMMVSAIYSDTPVMNPSAALVTPPSGVSITASTYYSFLANITISNGNAYEVTVELNINATVIRNTGTSQIQACDESSISEFGEIIFAFPDNALVQSATIAQQIADQLLSSYSNARRDLSMEWRGDPALELSDMITTDISRSSTGIFWLTRQTISWDGTLRATCDAIEASLEMQGYLFMTEDGYLWETEDSYIFETE
jgi:hypothetical protein